MHLRVVSVAMPVLRLSNCFQRVMVISQTVFLRCPELEKILKTKLKTVICDFVSIKEPSFRLQGRITLLSVMLAQRFSKCGAQPSGVGGERAKAL